MSTITVTMKDADPIEHKLCMGGGPVGTGGEWFGVHISNDKQILYSSVNILSVEITQDVADKMQLQQDIPRLPRGA
jgi:hypothetical protein